MANHVALNSSTDKSLRGWSKVNLRRKLIQRIAIENAATRTNPDSWEDVRREDALAKRKTLIYAAWARLQAKEGNKV